MRATQKILTLRIYLFLFLLASLATNQVFAQDTQPAQTEKPDIDPNQKSESTDEANIPVLESTDQSAEMAEMVESEKEAKTLPFRYLNQYFAYEIQLPENILLNDRSYDMSEFTVLSSDDRLKMTFGQVLSGVFKSGRLEFLDADKKKLSEREINFTGTKLDMESEIFPALTTVCLVEESKYSVLRMCKPINSKTEKYEDVEEVLKKVSADGADLGDSGQVVLQDAKVRSNLSVEFKNGDTFYFESERRKVYPATINKKADSLQINIRYVDLDDQTVAYDDVLIVGQRYFEIKLDPLISLRQDIVFSKEDISKKAFSRTLIDRAKVIIITKNKFMIAPVIAYQQIVGDDSHLKFELRSAMGIGLASQFVKNINPNWDWHVGGNFITTSIVYNEVSKTLTEKNQSLFELYGGSIYRINRTLDLQASFGLKNDLFVTPINVTAGLEVSAGMNKYLDAALIWRAYENELYELSVPVSFRLILPGKAGSVEAQTGTGYGFGANALVRTNWGRILLGMKYGSRIQKYDNFKFQEDYSHLLGGIVYLF